MDFIKTYLKLDNYTRNLVDSFHHKKRFEKYNLLRVIEKNMIRLRIKPIYINLFIEDIKRVNNL